VEVGNVFWLVVGELYTFTEGTWHVFGNHLKNIVIFSLA